MHYATWGGGIGVFISAMQCTMRRGVGGLVFSYLRCNALCDVGWGDWCFHICNAMHYATWGGGIGVFISAMQCTMRRGVGGLVFSHDLNDPLV